MYKDAKAYPGFLQISKMDCFATIVNDGKPFTLATKRWNLETPLKRRKTNSNLMLI